MTPEQARDELFGMLWDAWQLNAGTAAGGPIPALLWEDQELPEPPPQGSAYARATLKHSTGRQSALAGADATRRYTRTGLLIIQCFGPRDESGLAIAQALAVVAKDAFEGRSSSGGAWFRNCRTEEIGPETGWWQVNAVAEFTYEQVR